MLTTSVRINDAEKKHGKAAAAPTWGRLIGDAIRHIWTLNYEEVAPKHFEHLYAAQRYRWHTMGDWEQERLQRLVRRQMMARRLHLSESSSESEGDSRAEASSPETSSADF